MAGSNNDKGNEPHINPEYDSLRAYEYRFPIEISTTPQQKYGRIEKIKAVIELIKDCFLLFRKDK